MMMSCWIDVRLRPCFQFETTVLKSSDDLNLGLGGDKNVIREICGEEEDGAVLVRTQSIRVQV